MSLDDFVKGKNPQSKEDRQAIIKQFTEQSQLFKRHFQGPDGQAILAILRARSFVNVTTYDPDVKKMGMNEGRRSLFMFIVNEIEKDLTEAMEQLTKGEIPR